jgi:hypothetical protein
MIQVRRTPLSVEWGRVAPRSAWSDRAERWLEPAYCLAAIGLGAAQAWVCRFQPSTIDAVSYLDIGDAYVHGNWRDAINGYWNPLYSWILGVVFGVVPSSPRLEFPIAKLVDFVIFLATLATFRWFLKSVRLSYASACEREPGLPARIPDWAWVVVGYTVFLWSSLRWITLTSSTPDMCGTALAYLAWGLFLRLDEERPFQYPLLGGILAVGYFARTPMFVIAVIMLALAAFHGATPARRRGVMVAALIFLAMTAPMVAAISHLRHHLTIGENARLNHAWLANPGSYIIPNRHWQGGPPGYGVPKHPSRMIWDSPPAFEFGWPVGGTYPPWTDPSYWYEGLAYHFDGAAEWATVVDNTGFYFELFGRWGLLALAIVLIAAGHLSATLRGIGRNTRYWAPAAVGLALYLVAAELPEQWTSAQPPARYIAVFIVVLGLMLMASLRFRSIPSLAVRRVATVGLIVITAGAFTRLTADRIEASRLPAPTPPWIVAEALRESGVTPGVRVATIGSPARHSFWARLDRVQIVAEVPKDASFWAKPPALQGWILQSLEQAGAQVVVSAAVPPSALKRGWRIAGPDGFGVFWLGQESLNGRGAHRPDVLPPDGKLRAVHVTPARRPRVTA